MDEKKIEEVMRLVCEYGIACLDMDNDDYELSCHRTLIESKLRELVPVWLTIESAEKPAIGANGF